MATSNIFVIVYELADYARRPQLAYNLYYGEHSDIRPEAETNVSFLGRFVAPQHRILTALRQNVVNEPPPPPDQSASANIRVVIHDVPLPSLALYGRLYLQAPATDVDVVVAQAETNVSFLGRYAPASHKLLASLRQNPDTVSTDAFTAEAQPHFLGRFKAPVFARFPYSTWDTAVPAVETNPHWIGRFNAITHKIAPALRQNAALDVFTPPEAETQPHFLGRFKAPVHVRFNFNTWDTAVPQGETNTHFLGRFNAAVHKIAPALRQNVSFDQNETNTHWLGRFAPTAYRVLAQLRQNEAKDVTTVAEAETNPPFLGRFKAPIHARFPFNTWDTGVPVTDIANPHFLGRFAPSVLRILPALRQNEARDIDVTVQAETNVSFLGRFKAPVHARFPFNTWDTAVPAQETNTHFLGKFTAQTHTVLKGLRQHGSADFTETNPHFLGRFSASKHVVQPALRQNPALDVFVEQAGRDWIGRFRAQVHTIQTALRQTPNTDFATTATPETNPHFLGRHTPTRFARFPYNSLDTSVPVTDIANPHFVGRFTSRTHTLLSLLRQNVPSDTQRELNVANVIGRFVPYRHQLLAALRQNVPFDQNETNVSFIGRYTPVRYAINPALRQTPALDTPVAAQETTNIHFLGRYTAGAYRIAIALRQNVPSDTGRFETNPHFLGRYQAGTYKIGVWLRQNPAVEVRPDVPPHFKGHFTPPTHRLLPGLRQNFDTTSRSAFTAEAQPHFLGRHTPRRYTILPGLRQQIPLDIFITPETQPHFLGRFTATRYEILTAYRQNADVGEFIPTTPAWVFPQVEALYYIRAEVTAAYQVMPSVAEPGSMLSSHSPNPIERR